MPDNGKTISFLTIHDNWPFSRQLCNDVEGFVFIASDKDGIEINSDWLVVYDNIRHSFKTDVPKERRILFIAEPPDITTYPKKYLNQFGIVVSPYKLPGYNGKWIASHSALPWHFGVNRDNESSGVLNCNDLKNLTPPVKQNKISVICSSKQMTEGHRLRLKFLEKAKAVLGDRLEIYGRGFREIADKAEAILPYRFHLVLENNFVEHFWTEKLADAYLGMTYPVFSGCANIHDYFDRESLTTIDITSPDKAIETIQQLLDNPDFYYAHSDNVLQARNDILGKYNLFSVIQKITENSNSVGKIATQVVFPLEKFNIPPGKLKRLFLALKRKLVRVMTSKTTEKLNPIAYFINILTRLERKFYPTTNEANDPLRLMVEKWKREGGEDRMRYDYPLTRQSIVLDLGGYKGVWADALYARYGCKLFVYEPVKSFSDDLTWKYLPNPDIQVLSYGLGAKDEDLKINIEQEESSVYKTGENNQIIHLQAITKEFAEKNFEEVDLIKINIEGGEYDLLDSMIANGLAVKCKNFQIQFHNFMPDAIARREAIRNALSKTHRSTYSYDFIWENWERIN